MESSAKSCSRSRCIGRGARMNRHAEPLEGKPAGEELRVLASVIQEHGRGRVEVTQVAHQVDDAFDIFVHQAREHIAESRRCRGRILDPRFPVDASQSHCRQTPMFA